MLNIKLVVFDFDGVFTNGNIFFNNNGEITKYYNVKDGLGIKLLKEKNIKIGVISGYKYNKSQDNILKHLKIDFIKFEDKNKIETLNNWCKELSLKIDKEVAYMGDDINDITIMNKIYLSGCPNDAHKDVLKISSFVSKKKGGEGCIRDFCDFILNETINKSILYKIKNECNYQLNNIKLDDIEKIKNKIIEVNKNNNIYFTGIGKSENIAIHACSILKSLSIKCFYLNATNSTHGDIGTLKKNDLIILFSNSGNTRELINIMPNLKNKNVFIYGICCNKKSKFIELCDEVLILPFNKEIDCNINSIPTNSFMSFTFFINILATSISDYLSIEEYSCNHPAGNIGKDLQKISDVLIHHFPKIILKEKVQLHTILLKMTELKIGCCFFVDENDKLLGILTDGDIRRKIIENYKINYISINDINTNFYYETDENKLLKDCKNIGYIPLLNNLQKLLGIIKY